MTRPTLLDSVPRGLERFSREEAAGYDRTQIDNTDVCLVGTGALGQFCALCLALIGFRNVVFVDKDRFEESNISRSPFYTAGEQKAKAVALGARRLCTAIGEINYRYATCAVQRLGDALFQSDRDVIVLACVDILSARQWLAQRCRVVGVPLVEGGFRGERWNLSVFPNTNDDEPCWSCDRDEIESRGIFSCAAYARQAESEGFIPATAPGAMSLAAAQVEAAIALLHGDLRLTNSTLFMDLRAGSARVMYREANPQCPLDHRIVVADALALDCTPADTVGDLLAEVSKRVGQPIVHLPANYIRVAPCVECHQPARVEQPDWAIEDSIRCTECRGVFRRTDGVPEQHGFLSERTSESILGSRLAQLGIGPGIHLRVEGLCEDQVVCLAGDAHELLTLVE